MIVMRCAAAGTAAAAQSKPAGSKGRQAAVEPLQAAVHNAMNLVAAALLVGFAISLLWSEAQLVELNDQIQATKAQLVSEQSQYTYYNSTLNSKTNIASVEETAGRWV